jgi:hypothetical protein
MRDAHKLIETRKEIEDALSTTIKISHDQVLDIVVMDLVKKYKAALGRGDELGPAFEKVLRFYLTDDELKQMIDA